MRGFDELLTPPVAYKRIAITSERNTLTLGSKKKKLCSSQLHACHQMISTTSKMSLMKLQKGTISIQFRGRLFQFLHRAMTWSLSNLLAGMELCVTRA